MNQDSKDKIVTVAYDLIVNKGYSLNKSAVSLSVSKSTLRRWIDSSTILTREERASISAAFLHNKTFRTSDADIMQQIQFMHCHPTAVSSSFRDSLLEASNNLKFSRNR